MNRARHPPRTSIEGRTPRHTEYLACEPTHTKVKTRQPKCMVAEVRVVGARRVGGLAQAGDMGTSWGPNMLCKFIQLVVAPMYKFS